MVKNVTCAFPVRTPTGCLNSISDADTRRGRDGGEDTLNDGHGARRSRPARSPVATRQGRGQHESQRAKYPQQCSLYSVFDSVIRRPRRGPSILLEGGCGLGALSCSRAHPGAPPVGTCDRSDALRVRDRVPRCRRRCPSGLGHRSRARSGLGCSRGSAFSSELRAHHRRSGSTSSAAPSSAPPSLLSQRD